MKHSSYKYISPLATLTLIALANIQLMSCEDMVEIAPPKNKLSTPTVFTNDKTAEAAIRGIYTELTSDDGDGFSNGGELSVSTLAALSSDELINNSTFSTREEFAQNNLTGGNAYLSIVWNTAYKVIYEANAAVEGLATSRGVSVPVRDQLIGEAKFIRAFCHFYLVTLWEHVPLVLSTDYRVNNSILQSELPATYAAIIADLMEARQLLATDYTFNKGERTRVTAACASALLARIHLYLGNWTDAETYSTEVIAMTDQYSLVNDLDDVFLKGSAEALWQLYPTNIGWDTNEGLLLIPFPDSGSPPTYTLSAQLVNAFEPNDNRQTLWTNTAVIDGTEYVYPFKYKVSFKPQGTPLTEYSMVLRLAEQYLIRAEARTNLNSLASAADDINMIRNRAGLPNTSAITQPELLAAVARERRVELFTEWGHRWFDLNRTNQSDNVLGNMKPDWKTTDAYYPIPQAELAANPHLHQNPGY